MNRNFGRNKEYEQRLEGMLPKELERFRHSMLWPINPNTDEFHIAHYYLEEDRIFGFHYGIDIQVPDGTNVSAPENSRVISLAQDERDICLADLMLYSETGILYALSHINFFEMPKKTRECGLFDKYSSIKVEKGGQIAKVGCWPYPVEKYKYLPGEAKKKGGYYCHLHFETHYFPDISELSEFPRKSFNPLLVLKRL